jgi:hypothetical protein
LASPNIYSAGIGGTSGADLATVSPLYASGQAWYVLSTTGVDGASPAGLDRQKPLATLAQAVTNSAAGDVIVCLSTHVETLSSAQTIAKADLKLLGEGSGSNRPRFTRAADINMFDVTAGGFVCWNIYFPETTTTASTKSRLRTAAAMTVVRDCYFECGVKDTGPAFETITGASQILVRDTSFVSTAGSLTTQPHSAIKVTNALTDLELEAVSLDGSTYGWSNQHAFNGAAAVTRLRGLNVDLLNNSDATFATGTTGYFAVRYATGSARVVWTA